MTRVVVFSDFNCPFCYALNERLIRLGVDGGVEWRGVQHAPFLPIPLVPWQTDLQEELEREVATVQRLAPEVPISCPPGKPNTSFAIRAVAVAQRQDVQQARLFKDALYRALWQEGSDLSDLSMLTRLAGECGLAACAFDGAMGSWGKAEAEQWEQDWNHTRSGAVPAMVRSDGARLVGLVGAVQVQAFFADAQS
jgi:predicted DsbA family dithiol-disulfide isomerase